MRIGGRDWAASLSGSSSGEAFGPHRSTDGGPLAHPRAQFGHRLGNLNAEALGLEQRSMTLQIEIGGRVLLAEQERAGDAAVQPGQQTGGDKSAETGDSIAAKQLAGALKE